MIPQADFQRQGRRWRWYPPGDGEHYGDENSMKRWEEIGKPWGIGEHSMTYYGTPEQVSKYNGERAYESQLGRGLVALVSGSFHP